MKLAQLKALAVIAQTGSFQKAAIDLGISQPALSKTIRTLEEELGASLLDRGTKGTSLTAFGQVVRKRSYTIQMEMERLLDEVASLKDEVCGKLAVGFTSLAETVLGHGAIGHIHRFYPSVEVQLLNSRPAAMLDALNEGAIDIGLFTLHDRTELPDLECYLVAQYRSVLVGGGDGSDAVMPIRELLKKDWIESNLTDQPTGYIQTLTDRYGLPGPPRIHRCTSLNLCVTLAQELGAIYHMAEMALPYMEDALNNGRLSVMRTDVELPMLNIVMAYKRRELLTPAAYEMVKYIRAHNQPV